MTGQGRTSGVLVVAEHRQGALRDISLELISAGKELKAAGTGLLTVAVLGRDPASLAEGLRVEGVDEIVQVPLAVNEFNGDAYREAVRTLITQRRPMVTLTGFTVDAMSYAPAVAATLGTGFASDVVACSYEADEVSARRELFGGKVQADLAFPGKETVLLMLRPTVWPPAEGSGSPSVSTLESPIDGSRIRTTHRTYVAVAATDVDITGADLILSIGRGIGERENIPQFEKLAGRLGATLACSRPVVDAGWLPAARQVGQSGKTVKPKVYLAFGISGAVQHLVGMKASGTVIAVNTDAEAAIFSVAHYGAVADLFRVAEELAQLT